MGKSLASNQAPSLLRGPEVFGVPSSLVAGRLYSVQSTQLVLSVLLQRSSGHGYCLPQLVWAEAMPTGNRWVRA